VLGLPTQAKAEQRPKPPVTSDAPLAIQGNRAPGESLALLGVRDAVGERPHDAKVTTSTPENEADGVAPLRTAAAGR
jgi:hypothetical protein